MRYRSMRYACRVSAWGAGGRVFESLRPDHFSSRTQRKSPLTLASTRVFLWVFIAPLVQPTHADVSRIGATIPAAGTRARRRSPRSATRLRCERSTGSRKDRVGDIADVALVPDATLATAAIGHNQTSRSVPESGLSTVE